MFFGPIKWNKLRSQFVYFSFYEMENQKDTLHLGEETEVNQKTMFSTKLVYFKWLEKVLSISWIRLNY